jgi:hypothetical protein
MNGEWFCSECVVYFRDEDIFIDEGIILCPVCRSVLVEGSEAFYTEEDETDD